MAKVKITGVKELGAAIIKATHLIETDSGLFKDMGEYTVKGIVGNARLGADPDRTNLKDISSAWDKRRKRLATVNDTDENYKPSSRKARLTFTGQLLKSFSFSIFPKSLSMSFFFKGNRAPYRGLRKPVLKGPATNAQLAASIEEQRPFVFLGKKMKSVLLSKVVKSLRRSLRDYKRLSRLLG
jgi:hypothetical protein